MAGNKEQLAIIKRDVVDIVEGKISSFITNGELNLPANYSPQNALRSAWLILQETKAKTPDKQEVPALTYCTRDSIANALLNMVVQGLNPAKHQCYFIAYGNQLLCQRSYFGNIYLAKLVNPEIEDIVGTIVYEDDEFEYGFRRGKKVITKHTQKLANIDKRKIIAAYATVLRKDGDESKEYSEVMDIDEIKQAWKQSKMYPIDNQGQIKTGTTHDKFTSEMAKKTVINRICKQIVNSSTDSYLILDAYHKTDDAVVDAEVKATIQDKANREVIDVTPTEPVSDTMQEDQEHETTTQETSVADAAEEPAF